MRTEARDNPVMEEFRRRIEELSRKIDEFRKLFAELIDAMRDREADTFPADTSLLELYVEALNGAPFEPETYRHSRSKEPKDGHPP